MNQINIIFRVIKFYKYKRKGASIVNGNKTRRFSDSSVICMYKTYSHEIHKVFFLVLKQFSKRKSKH